MSTLNAAPNVGNLSNFGDGISNSNNSGRADWDYIFLIQEDNSVPEPATWVLMAVGLVLIAGKRVVTGSVKKR